MVMVFFEFVKVLVFYDKKIKWCIYYRIVDFFFGVFLVNFEDYYNLYDVMVMI